MNWWAKRAAWCSVFILLFSACNKDSEIGTGINPTNPIGTSYTDTISILTSTILIDDSINSSGQSYLMAGAYHDPYTGDISAEAYAEFKLKDENRDITGFDYDSARLYLDYSGYYYGDTMQDQTFEIYELDESLLNATTYFTQSDAPADKGIIIGSKTFKATPNTSSGSQLVINIDDTWAEDVLTLGNNSTNATFVNQMKGIAIKPQNPDEGAILRLKSTATTCKMVIYFKIGSENKQFTLYMNGDGYYRIEGDRSSTDIAGLADAYDEVSSSVSNDVTYVQAGVGLKTKFTLPYIHKFQEKAGIVAINKVNLILPFAESSADDFSPLTALFFIQTDATNKVKRDASGNVLTIQQNNTVQTGVQYPLFVTYNKDKNRYEVDMTDYFQSLLTGKLDNEGFYISPSYNSLLLNRTVLNSQSPSLTKPLKLEVYYTLLE